MEFSSAGGERAYAALLRSADDLLVGLDFDGTLAPIVADPAAATIHPGAAEVLVDLAGVCGTVAVITGRPARQALALGGLDEVGELVVERGRELVVLGQYGHERWTSSTRRVASPKPPPGLSGLLADLPELLGEADVVDAWVEEKGLAVAVHTRRTADPAAAFARLLPVLSDAAHTHGLGIEPGRLVIELRAPGMDKGRALRELVVERQAGAAMFVGDDLGDLAAFAALVELRRAGMPTLRVCSGSVEESALREHADLVVAGPDGVLAFLRELTEDLRAPR